MDIRCNSPGTIFFVIELLAVILFYSLLPMHFGASGEWKASTQILVDSFMCFIHLLQTGLAINIKGNSDEPANARRGACNPAPSG
jgi:hypothetical protein